MGDIMKRVRIALFVIVALSLAVPSVAFADSWAEKQAGNILMYLLKFFFEPVFDALVDMLGSIMVTPSFDSPTLSYVKTVNQDLQIAAGSLLVLTVTFRLFKIKMGNITGGQVEPVPDMLWRALMSAVMISGLPFFLEKMIELNRVLIDYIKFKGVDMTQSLNMLSFPGNNGIVMLLAFIIFIVALVALAISNAIRIAELCMLYVFAPIMAVSHAGKGETFQIWITQALTVTFTQSVQFFMVGFALNLTANIAAYEWWAWLAPIGAIVVAIRGPQILKQFLYSSGVGGFAGGMAQSAASSAIYTKMMKVGK